MAWAGRAPLTWSSRPPACLIQPLVRSASERVSRRLQVYQTVLDAIHRAVLMPGARLPSARQLATDWGVARGAVDEAFAQLQSRGLSRAPRRRRHLCDAPAATDRSIGRTARAAPAEPVGAAGAEPLFGLPRQTQAGGAAARAADAGAAVPARADDRAVPAGHLAAPDDARARRGVPRAPELRRRRPACRRCARPSRATCR